MKVTITESIALATSSLGFIFSLISSFTPAWSVINGSNGTYHIGHIHGCDFTNESGKCRKLGMLSRKYGYKKAKSISYIFGGTYPN